MTTSYFQPHQPVKQPGDTEKHPGVIEGFAGEPNKGNYEVGDHVPDKSPVRRRGRS